MYHCAIMQVTKVHSFSLKVHEKSYGGRALPGSAGGAFSATHKALTGFSGREELKEKEVGWEGRER